MSPLLDAGDKTINDNPKKAEISINILSFAHCFVLGMKL